MKRGNSLQGQSLPAIWDQGIPSNSIFLWCLQGLLSTREDLAPNNEKLSTGWTQIWFFFLTLKNFVVEQKVFILSP